MNKKDSRIIAKNPNAYHNYEIIEKIETGIVLYGTEIKSIRAGKVNLKGIVTDIFGLDEAQKAMDYSVNNKADIVKAVIKISE